MMRVLIVLLGLGALTACAPTSVWHPVDASADSARTLMAERKALGQQSLVACDGGDRPIFISKPNISADAVEGVEITAGPNGERVEEPRRLTYDQITYFLREERKSQAATAPITRPSCTKPYTKPMRICSSLPDDADSEARANCVKPV